MLTTIGAGSSGGHVFDYASSYAGSTLRERNLALIDEFCSAATESNLVSFPRKYATCTKTQFKAVVNRVAKIYWRSPNYNLNRLMVSAAIALLFGKCHFGTQLLSQANGANVNALMWQGVCTLVRGRPKTKQI